MPGPVETLLAISESTGIAAFMTTRWGWPIIESVHFIGLSLLIGTVGVFDLRMLGLAPRVPLAALHRLIPFGVLGYLMNVATGLMFLSTYPDQYLYNPAFQVKISLMLLAGVNVLLFYGTTFAAVKAGPDAAALALRVRLMAAVSLLCWLGVITCGRLITFFRPPYYWCFWC